MTGEVMVFDHISIAMERLADAPAVLVGILGGTADSGAPSQVFRWGCWRYAGGGRLEVIEPRGPDGFLHRFLAQRGPGIHHVTFKVPNLGAACDRAETNGYAVVGYDDADPDWKEAFLHPKQALGIVVQLAEARGDDAERWPWTPLPAPDAPPAPVTIVGLRLRAVERERALVQWGRVLGGVATERPGGELAFRWPGSPMGVVVEIDPHGEDGPLCIEVVSDRALTIPPPLGRLIGTRFVQADPVGRGAST
jgi:methylmalonyl-CoA/ethylmalonyl-CoA epimerase